MVVMVNWCTGSCVGGDGISDVVMVSLLRWQCCVGCVGISGGVQW